MECDSEPRGTRALRLAAVVVCIVLGALSAWGARHQMNSDGIAYLDMSDAALTGFRTGAYNPYWSPALPVLIAAERWVAGTGPANDYAAAHIAVFILYLAALLGLDYLVRTLLALDRARAPERPDGDARDSTATFLLLGYAAFVWAAIGLITLGMITPDLGVAAVIFIAAALALRLVRGGGGVGAAVGLGVTLGVGFLVKAAMLPIGLVVLALVVACTRARRALTHTVLAGALFAGIAAPQIVAVSRAAGHIAFSPVGGLVYGWYVDLLPCPLWSTTIECLGLHDGATLSTANPPQPFPRAHTDPSVFVFTSESRGTYPAWYDPTHWYPHFMPVVRPVQQLRALVDNLVLDWNDLLPFLVAGVAFALVWGRRSGARAIARQLTPDPLLLLLGCAGILMYALVYTESRYTAPFAVLLVLGSATRMRTIAAWRSHRMLLAAALIGAVGAIGPALRDAWWERAAPDRALTIARALHGAGVPEATPIGVIGNGYVASFWARPARLRIIAQIHQSEADRFWSAAPAEQMAVLDAFRRAGARAVVASGAPAWARTSGWTPVAGSGGLLLTSP